MLFLIINPESDYEMFSNGDIEDCTQEVEQRIVEADSADSAIYEYIKNNEGSVEADRFEYYFALQVASKKCEVASSSLVDTIQEEEQKEKVAAATAVERAELARLKNKYEGK